MTEQQIPYLAQRRYSMRKREEKLEREERRWLPIGAATGMEGVNLEEKVLANLAAETLQQALERLSKRDRIVLESVAAGFTMEEIGNRFRVSRARAQQIAQAAMARVRELSIHDKELSLLKDYFR